MSRRARLACFLSLIVRLVGETARYFVASLDALLGGVWAVSRHKTIALKGLSARVLEETRTVAPGNLAELLLLNDGKRVSLTLMFPGRGEAQMLPPIERHEGILRVFKPSLRYEDAYPTEDAPPEYFLSPTPRPSRKEIFKHPPSLPSP